eukprot:CAMPEP_0175043404 /NCGR_PEP_ID=MMETSP0052_2-20121109/3168_1 /TAXON_ID=51329 ORGANISM="Polytomella parva, Strain SAG 63-3" /NCGR_SAMPLE_ID=MMETSP0052_2 /ASSEMBLY_ACC=CAM_ASM_000194 /LENGTH=242 /DNA_ID=CAMNT_0016306459 /DNA_START=32 /DNA_END=757 /DNA_ORIENTATION=-
MSSGTKGKGAGASSKTGASAVGRNGSSQSGGNNKSKKTNTQENASKSTSAAGTAVSTNLASPNPPVNASKDTKVAPNGSAYKNRATNVSAQKNMPKNDRLVFITTALIGYTVEVHFENGEVYEGIFHAYNCDEIPAAPSDASFDNSSAPIGGIMLKYARLIYDPKNPTLSKDAKAKKPITNHSFYVKDMEYFFVKDVSLEDGNGDDDFETDAAISRGRGGTVRTLQKFALDECQDPNVMFGL